jgi:hypothetical protein
MDILPSMRKNALRSATQDVVVEERLTYAPRRFSRALEKVPDAHIEGFWTRLSKSHCSGGKS